jgi:DNA gyrase/topoisomerase IV subunit B
MAESASTTQTVTIKSVRRITTKEPVPVYDATVPIHHNFCLGNGVVVHNTAKNARDSRFQEVFKLRGKLTNSSRTNMAALLKSQVIQNLLVALGVDLKSIDLDAESISDMTFSTENLRIGNVMVLCDADTDGSHIAVLLLSAFYRLLPTLFAEGRVYICLTPLFLCQYKDTLYHGMALEDVQNQLPDNAKPPITRAKGLGELNASVLRDVAFDVNNRHLIKVTPPHDADAEAYFYAITGSNSQARKELLGLSE